MTSREELIVLTAYFVGVLLLWTPVIIDTIRSERGRK